MDSNTSSFYDTGSTAASGGNLLVSFFLLASLVICLAVIVLSILVMWRLYRKANKPGWASIVPIYNYIVLLEIIGRPIWWIVFTFVPFVCIYFAFVVMIDLAKSFGKSTGFGVVLFFLPFIGYPMLAFSKHAQYVGPVAEGFDGFTPAPSRASAAPAMTSSGQPVPPMQPPVAPLASQPPQAPSDPGQPQPPQL